MNYWLQILKAKVKVILNLPITRVEVLKLAKAKVERNPKEYPGLCILLENTINMNYNIWLKDPRWVFPLYNPMYAKLFGATTDIGFWWERDEWDTGRLDFLNWLIEQYKDDKTDIRDLKTT